jgi:protease-4
MKLVRESIFSSAIRSFCIAFFAVFGIMIAVFLLMLVFGSGKYSKSMDNSTFDAIIPDTNGRKYSFTSNKPLLLRVDINGVIGMNQGISITQIRSLLDASRTGLLKNHPIKGILLYIDSPGGGASTSESIYYALKEYAAKYEIPVFTFVEGLCASGGYMIACASNKIYASNASMIGSVGTYMSFFNISGTMDKVGVENWTISKGKNKVAMTPFQPWDQNSDAPFLPLLDATYDQFVSIVAKERKKVTKEELINTYGANVFMSAQAEQIGYIDGAGYQYDQVVELLAKEANLEEYELISLQPKAKLSDLFKFDAFSSATGLKELQKKLLLSYPIPVEPLLIQNPVPAL